MECADDRRSFREARETVVIGTLKAFIVKELRHILRDRQTLTIMLMMPLVQVVLFGYALRSDVRDVRLVVVDPSPDYATLALRARLAAAGRFRIVATEPSMTEVEPYFRRGHADMALAFEPDFAKSLESAEPARLLLATIATSPFSLSQHPSPDTYDKDSGRR